MKFYLVAALAVLFSADVVDAQGQASGKKGFQLTNNFRKKNGKPAQRWSGDLYTQCAKHNQYQAKARKISHDGF